MRLDSFNEDRSNELVSRSGTFPTLLVCTRFGLGIRERRWFDHRLRLIEAITASSLARQTCQQFVWAVFIDPDLDEEIRSELTEVIGGVQNAIIVDSGSHNTRAVLQLATKLDLSQNGYVLTGRIDDDDAWARDTVERIYGISAQWLAENPGQNRPGAAMTFAHGLEWLMYDMIDVDKRARGEDVIRHQALRSYEFPFHSMSVFVLASQEMQLAAMSARHMDVAKVFGDRGFDLIRDDITKDMWLYTRHKQVVSSVQKAKGAYRAVDTHALEARFGVNADLLHKYVGEQHIYGYAVEKRTVWRRTALKREIKELERRLVTDGLSSEDSAQLAKLREEREQELFRITHHVVGEL